MHVTTAIVGAGFCGLGLAIRLKQAGLDDFVVFERRAEVGGTWRDNNYPGCACDVQSHLYSFSFAPNPGWTRLYSPAAEIQRYLVGCTERFGLARHMRYDHTVEHAAWDEAAKLWRIKTTRGDYTATTLALAPGPLSEPKIPELPGIAAFRGKIFHSAAWDHGYDLGGKRVAVIGTGASAIQFIPKIQPLVKSLTVVQRTPAWVMPRDDKPVPEWQRRLQQRFPPAQLWWRLRTYLFREFTGYIFRQRRLSPLTEYFAKKHLAKAVSSPELRARLTPSYTIGCKRTLLSDDFYPAVAQPNVEVLASGLTALTATGIVLADGSERAVDAVIFGTGFYILETPYSGAVVGRGGRSLADAWKGSPQAHLGTAVAGFPNMFLLLGPNTGLGHSSILLMAEAQIEHVVGALRFKRDEGVATLEPKPARQAQFVAEVDRGHVGGIWQAGGCKSWYMDVNGRNSAIWPRSVPAFRRRVARFSPGDYALDFVRSPQRRPEAPPTSKDARPAGR